MKRLRDRSDVKLVLRMCIGAAVLISVTMSAPANAAFVSYEKIYRNCFARTGVDAEATKWGICFGYLAAVADAFENGGSVHGKKACLPQTTSMRFIWDAVHAWMKKNPGNLIPNGTTMVAKAMEEIFPCKP